MASLLIRADGGPGIGAGHLGRCLALAQAWRDTGGDVMLVSDTPPPDWAERYRREGASVSEPDREWLDAPADWVVLDGYSFSSQDQEHVKAAGHRLVVVDDHGSAGRYVADMIIDQNLGASADLYAARPTRSALLLGPAFALLRREFRRAPAVIRDVGGDVLVLLGGSPPADAEKFVEQALRELDGVNIVRPRDSDRVADAMAGADLAVAGAGVTTWELCAIGLPAVLVVLADNQAPVAAAVAGAGAAVSVGDLHDLTSDALAHAVHRLLASGDDRRAMATLQRQLVDARGARRVVARLNAAMLDLRPATADDARLLWEWANDDAVRRFSFSPEPIPWADHVAWLDRTLSDQLRHLYLATDRVGRPVGQIRFDIRDSEAEVDVSVAPDQRGRGLGPAIIAAGAERLLSELPATRAVARIRPENVRSAEAFAVAGFQFEGERSDGDDHWLLYSRERDDAGG